MKEPQPARRIKSLCFAWYLQIKEASISPSPFGPSPSRPLAKLMLMYWNKAKMPQLLLPLLWASLSNTIGLWREYICSWSLQRWAYFLKCEIWLVISPSRITDTICQKRSWALFCWKSQARFFKIWILQGNKLLGGIEFFCLLLHICCNLHYWSI